MSGPRQTIQYTQQRLALAPARRGEPLAADRPGTEPPTAKRTTDRPAAEDQLMEEVCDRSNLEKAWKRVRRNKGGPGVDGLTIDDTATYLREHWPTIRAQLLTGTYHARRQLAPHVVERAAAGRVLERRQRRLRGQ